MHYEKILIMNCPHPVESVKLKSEVQNFYTDDSVLPFATKVVSETAVCKECGTVAKIEFKPIEPPYKFMDDWDDEIDN